MSTITTISPATEEKIQTYTLMTEQEATDPIAACHAAFPGWRKLSHHERPPVSTKIGEKLREHADEVAALMMRETGKPVKDGSLKLRFVMLTSVGAYLSEPTGDMAHHLKAKHDADEHLKASGMAYAILRPVTLTNDRRGAKVILGEDVDKSAKAARANLTYVLAESAITGRFDGIAQNMQSA
jgi:acyl-CoA reductase-like NAD-dependent aldehyde dehydrogenase